MVSIKKRIDLRNEKDLMEEIKDLQKRLNKNYKVEPEILVKRKQNNLESLYYERANQIIVIIVISCYLDGERR